MTRVQSELDWLAAEHARFCEIRRAFHRHPEIAFEEEWTSQELAKRLEALGCQISRRIGGTGFVATLGGGNGPAVALRTDMDALPLTEATGLPFASEIPGRMHACGHDGHMTLLLAVAELLARRATGGEPLPGPVHFICQPAEEVGRGADAMIADGLFDEIAPALTFGFHNWPELPLGTVAAREGAIMAAYHQIGFTLDGKGGHAALPALSDDLYGAMAALITRMNARLRHELTGAPTAFAFTQNMGGTAANIIPSHLEVSASFRFVDPAHGIAAAGIAAEVAAEISAAFGLSVAPVIRRIFDPTSNASAAVDLVAEVTAAAARGLDWQEAPAPSMVSEDFGAMIAERPGCYFWLGAGMEAGALHNNRFNFNEALLLNAPQLVADVLRAASAEAATA
ncbi:M20 metallopeptidase family protein [Paracoccus aminophilus]|uniref:Hippurate hydrolase n=1 Tax=Paracoccus aminophilus JCM 7686 TaxID=1367847 RepID=S5Z012_PARAH|nr:M20 family metallopeptidase [Paracoccus aminophilus]AGT10796.1 hippurate hydrolase [Paracoccus aminophilus JCM 7686]